MLSLVTGFLKTNPAAAEAAKAFAGAPATQAFIKTVSGLAIGIGPAEKAALVCASGLRLDALPALGFADALERGIITVAAKGCCWIQLC